MPAEFALLNFPTYREGVTHLSFAPKHSKKAMGADSTKGRS